MEIKELLEQCGFQGKVNHRGEIDLQYCCFHEHNFRSPSLRINIEKQQFRCWSCGKAGHIRRIFYHFGIEFSGWGSIKDEKELDKNLDGIISEFSLKEEELNKADPSELKAYRYSHPYLLRRGFTKEILLKNNIGFDKETVRVTIPIYFNGRYYGCIKRSACGFEPRYIYPENLQKSSIIYSPKPVSLKRNDIEFWVEGSIDALKIASYGYAVHSILGCMFSTVQMRIMEKSPRKKIIMLDNDKAGKEGTEHLLQLTKANNLEIFQYPENVKDPGDITLEQLENGLETGQDRLDLLLSW